MNKYDEYIEKYRDELNNYVSKLKAIAEKKKSKDEDEEQLQREIYSLQVEITELERNLDILRSAPSVKKKELQKDLLMYGGLLILSLLMVNVFRPALENIGVDIILVVAVVLYGKCSYEIFIKDIREVEKKYTIPELEGEIKSKKMALSRKNNELYENSIKLNKLYEEKEELKNIIIDLNNTIKELERGRLAVMERSLMPSIEAVLDEDFEVTYGDGNPLDIVARSRKNKRA